MFANPAAPEIARLLRAVRTIAVVGLSPHPARPSNHVARALQRCGFRIVPVRPAVHEVLGEPAYRSLRDLPLALLRQVDLVDVFRNPAQVDAVVDDCIALGLKSLWLQDGVINEAAAARARAAGITVVMDRCVWRDYATLVACEESPT
jgi:predicted CoA-binding protein